jgi:hypothetical protein
LVGAGKTVFLRGAPTEVAGVLRALFAELRPKYRAACTFDTACLTEGFVPGTFWAVGGTFQPTGADCVEVDLDARQVLLDGTDLGSNLNLDLYERWEATARDAGAREKIVRLGPTVEVLAGVLRPGGELVSVAGLDMDAWRELCAAFPDEIAADLARRLNGWLPKRLADGLGEYLRHALETEAPWWLSQTEAEAGLTDWLAEWIARVQPDLGRADRAKLRELGTRPGGRALAFWGLSTGLWPNHSGARKVLGDMTPAEFATAVRLMGHTIPAARFVHSRHLAAAVEAIARAVIPESEFLSAGSAVLREGGAAVLDPLAERVGGLSAAGARRLARELTDAGAGETALARAVARRVAPQPPARVRPAAQFG